MKKQSPFGQTVVLTTPAVDVECWNFVGHSRHVLPVGTRLLIEHVYDCQHITCMLVDEQGNHPGMDCVTADGKVQKGYRFIIDNKQLTKLTGLKFPRQNRDIVGEIIAHESGELDQEGTLRLFRKLKKDGTLKGLQGSYGRTAQSLGI